MGGPPEHEKREDGRRRPGLRNRAGLLQRRGHDSLRSLVAFRELVSEAGKNSAVRFIPAITQGVIGETVGLSFNRVQEKVGGRGGGGASPGSERIVHGE